MPTAWPAKTVGSLTCFRAGKPDLALKPTPVSHPAVAQPSERLKSPCYTPADFASVATPLVSENAAKVAIVISLPDTFNAATYFIDRHVHEGRSQDIAIECGDERVSYQQLLERTNRVGNALRNLGVRPEERVLLLLLDTPEFLYSFFGAIKIGAVAVPVNTQAKPHDYEYILNDSCAHIAIASETLLQHLQAIPRENLRYLREIILVGDANPANQYPRLCDLMDAASP